MRRLIFPVLLGLAGTLVLASLGMWQMQRMAWKEGILADMQARIHDAPVSLPESPMQDQDQFLSVKVSGTYLSGDLPVLASNRDVGALFRIVAPFQIDNGRTILVDRGYVLDELLDRPRPAGDATLIGNLHWPDEINSSTPDPDLKAGIWFARDIPAMAKALGTEPTLLVVRETSETNIEITPFPVDTAAIPNNHFSYAVQWFGFALVWACMSLLLIWRQTRKNEG